MRVYMIMYTNDHDSSVIIYEKGYTDLEECKTMAIALEKQLWTDEMNEEDENPWQTWIKSVEVEEKLAGVKEYDSRSTWKLIEEIKNNNYMWGRFDDWRNEHERDVTANEIKKMVVEDWYVDVITDINDVNWQQVAYDLNEMD